MKERQWKKLKVILAVSLKIEVEWIFFPDGEFGSAITI